MKLYETWVELDLNPILSFSSQGKILFSNQEAQFLLSRISSKDIFDLALKHAPQTFDFQTSYIDLTIKNYTFYAITVGYENEDEIHIKLYKSTMVKKKKELSSSNANMTNLFTLVDLSISTKKMQSNTKYLKNYDPSIPEFKMVAAEFLKLLNTVYEQITHATTVTTSIKLKIGEYIRIDEKKYSLISVEITSDGTFAQIDMNKDQDSNSFILSVEEDKVTIDLPLLL